MTRRELAQIIGDAVGSTDFADDIEAGRSAMACVMARAGAKALGKEYSGSLAYHVRMAMEWSEPRRRKQIKSGCSNAQLGEWFLLFYWDMAGAVANYFNVKLAEAEPWRIWRKVAAYRR